MSVNQTCGSISELSIMFHGSTCLSIPVQIPNFMYYCSFIVGLTAGTSGSNKLTSTFHLFSTTISLLEGGGGGMWSKLAPSEFYDIYWEFWDTTDLCCFLSVLNNMVATGHVWLFKWRLMKVKTSVLQLHESHFKCSAAVHGWWLPCWAAQTQNISIMAGSSTA